MPHRVSNYINKGPIKLFSNYVNISEPHFEATGINIPADITFLEFRIAKYKYVLYTDDNTANQWVRPFPRRWYMEENKDQGRIPWFEDREEIQPIFREFNKWNPLVINGKMHMIFLKSMILAQLNFITLMILMKRIKRIFSANIHSMIVNMISLLIIILNFYFATQSLERILNKFWNTESYLEGYLFLQ